MRNQTRKPADLRNYANERVYHINNLLIPFFNLLFNIITKITKEDFMNKNEVYKVAFELAQKGNSVLLFAFESTKSVVYEILVSEYTNTPMQILREDSTFAKQKQEEFLNMVDKDRNIFVISEVKLSNSEIEDHILNYKNTHTLTHVIFDTNIESDFFFHLQSKYSVVVISSTFQTGLV